MILAQAAEPPAAIDPTLLVFLSIFGAAGVTAIAGFALAIWQSKRDHARWLRERRYDGFTRLLAIADRYSRYRAEGVALVARSQELQTAVAGGDASVGAELNELEEMMVRNLEKVTPLADEIIDVVAALEILGPADALEAMNMFTDKIEGEDADAEDAKDEYIEAVRKSLGIKA